ncbi:MAG: hypothetical protein M3R39_10690 [Actinomycetota bacterium]|nr:hypothetical protein [Actinomycetota bacterium]
MDPVETMRQFALALLEAVDEDGDIGALTRYLDERSHLLDPEAMVAISTTAVTFLALRTGVNLRTAAESISEAAGSG